MMFFLSTLGDSFRQVQWEARGMLERSKAIKCPSAAWIVQGGGLSQPHVIKEWWEEHVSPETPKLNGQNFPWFPGVDFPQQNQLSHELLMGSHLFSSDSHLKFIDVVAIPMFGLEFSSPTSRWITSLWAPRRCGCRGVVLGYCDTFHSKYLLHLEQIHKNHES